MQVELLRPDARAPKRPSPQAAGFDICAAADGCVPARFDLKSNILMLAVILFLLLTEVSHVYVLYVAMLFVAAMALVVPSVTVPTGLRIAVPSGTYGRLAPRSGLAANYGIGVGAGVIDADYRGEIQVVLFNHGISHYHFRQGDRIAQLIVESIASTDVVLCKVEDSTVRGSGGFGSSGR